MPTRTVARTTARLALATAVLMGLLSACTEYHGPITNAGEGYHQVGAPVGA